MVEKDDISIIRDLTCKYLEICNRPEQDRLRNLWRDHNSLERTRPLIIVSGGSAYASEIPQVYRLQCEDPFWKPYESDLRKNIFDAGLGDDRIFEPWLTLRARYKCRGWGVKVDRRQADEDGGSFKVDYPIKEESDIEKLRMPWHELDEEQMEADYQRLYDAVGDLITISVDRSPAYRTWSGDIATDLGYLRGIENFMLDMADRPHWLHQLADFLKEGILRTHKQAEEAGDWGLNNHENQSMPYARELKDPAPDHQGVGRDQLWYFAAAQEFALVGPRQHEEFLLKYQIPIMSKFGLTAYGCCEDLTQKIDILRQIPNLRRIAVTPWADVEKCAEQIGTDYVISWRPSPAQMVCTDFSEERIRRITEEALKACEGQHVDICLKDIQTVCNEPKRLRKWVDITRSLAEKYA